MLLYFKTLKIVQRGILNQVLNNKKVNIKQRFIQKNKW